MVSIHRLMRRHLLANKDSITVHVMSGTLSSQRSLVEGDPNCSAASQ